MDAVRMVESQGMFGKALSELRSSVIVRGFVATLLLAAAGYLGLQAYRWKQNVDLRGYRSDLAYSYLADAIKGPDGKPSVNRSQVLDALVQQAVAAIAQQQAAKGQPPMVAQPAQPKK